MTLELAGWLAAAVCAILAAAAFIWQRGLLRAQRARTRAAERRFEMLHHLAPALTSASTESVGATCARILDRFASLVGAQTLLCFFAADDRLVLGARAGAGYVGFLREGESYEGDTIVDWVRDSACAGIVGPQRTNFHPHLGVADLSKDPELEKLGVGPLAGSRDRVWALALPLVRSRGYGLRPEVLGVVYAERPKSEPFTEEDLSTAQTIARLAADALARAIFADRLRFESDIDPLTKLLTPAAFRKRLREAVETRRYATGLESREVALFFIDTDNFKVWNDTFGHAAGDKLLKRLSELYRGVADQAHGFAGRNGGDEFCIALLDRSKDDAIAVAEDLRAKVHALDPSDLLEANEKRRLPITVSIGVAHYPYDAAARDPQPSDRLLEAADARMYDAKRGGRNRVAFARGRPLAARARPFM